jgi:predicted negative regulator of RcsB-dependent stress response
MSKRRPPAHRPDPSHKKAGGGDHEDAFISRILGFSLWAKQNTQTLIIGVAVLVLIIAGSVYYLNFRSATSVQATAELAQIQQVVAMGEREQAKTELASFLERYGDTRQATEARLNLGELYMQEGNPAAAIEALQPATRSLRNNPVGLQAAALLAAAYEEEGRLQEAEETYLEVANRAELPFQIQDAITSAARLRVEQGNHAGAESLYRQLIDGMDEDDPLRAIYEMRMAEISAQRRG